MKYRIFITNGSRFWFHSRKRFWDKTQRWTKNLSQYFTERLDADCQVFLWPGDFKGPWDKSIQASCWQSLNKINFCEEPQEPIKKILFLKSNGAILVENTLKRYFPDLPNDYFDLELRVASPLKGSKWWDAKVRNRCLLYSNNDLLYLLAGFYLGAKRQFNYDSTKLSKIQISGLFHHQFNKDNKITIKKQKITLYHYYALLIQALN